MMTQAQNTYNLKTTASKLYQKSVMNECEGQTKRDAGSAVREQSFGLDFWFF
jgi:hypothetical protein